MQTLQEYYDRLFYYENGKLYRRTPYRGGILSKPCYEKLKDRNGTPHRVFIQVGGKSVTMHKVVWVMHNSDVPNNMTIDHIDENPFNNSIENLQLLTAIENTQKSARSRLSGYIGVWQKSRESTNYAASVYVSGKTKHLGQFKTALEAAIFRNCYIDEHNLSSRKNIIED